MVSNRSLVRVLGHCCFLHSKDTSFTRDDPLQPRQVDTAGACVFLKSRVTVTVQVDSDLKHHSLCAFFIGSKICAAEITGHGMSGSIMQAKLCAWQRDSHETIWGYPAAVDELFDKLVAKAGGGYAPSL